MDDNELPDEYETLGMPFTRSTRPLADYGAANHALEEHGPEAAYEEGKQHFPAGYFGTKDDDQLTSMKELMDLVTFIAEPVQTGKVSLAWDFTAEVKGVTVRVPVVTDDYTGKLAPKTAIPERGNGVTIDRNGERELL